MLGGRHINQNAFFLRLMYIAYGIQYDYPHYGNELKPADVIATTFGTAEGVSCAFMNISKFSNERVDVWKSDWASISKSKMAADYGFIRQEVSILVPEMIIALNIEWALKYMVNEGSLQQVDSIGSDLDVFSAALNGKLCHIFNAWHFAALKGRKFTDSSVDLDYFYAPDTS